MQYHHASTTAMQAIKPERNRCIVVVFDAYIIYSDVCISNKATSASERGGLIDVPKAENTHLQRENVSGRDGGLHNAPTGQNSHQLVATWLRLYININFAEGRIRHLRGALAKNWYRYIF